MQFSQRLKSEQRNAGMEHCAFSPPILLISSLHFIPIIVSIPCFVSKSSYGVWGVLTHVVIALLQTFSDNQPCNILVWHFSEKSSGMVLSWPRKYQYAIHATSNPEFSTGKNKQVIKLRISSVIYTFIRHEDRLEYNIK